MSTNDFGSRPVPPLEDAVMRSFLESMRDGVIWADQKGLIQFINSAAREMFGWADTDPTGMALTVLMPAKYRKPHEAGLHRLQQTGETRVIGKILTLEGLRRTGEAFPIELSLSQWIFGGKSYYCGVVRDISERLKEAQARHQAEAQNEAKDQFLATVSHELRTPLNAMLGWIVLARSQAVDTATVTRALEVIERNTRHQIRLVEDVLDVSSILSGVYRLKGQSVELGSIIDAAVEEIRTAADKKDLDLTVQRVDTASVWGDPIRLRQVMWNLLANAVKFTPAGGRVDLTLQVTRDEAVLSVSDTGPGLPPEFLPHVFEPFRQADSAITRRHGGLGLGLAIAQRVVALHDGTITAKNAGPAGGAIFTVRLPRLHEKKRVALKSEAAAAKPLAQDRPLEGVRVLAVDDDPDTCELAKTILGKAGAAVETCASAVEALGAFRAAPPDVLVVDLAMPGEDGIALIRKVRALKPEQGGGTPAIAVTAHVKAYDSSAVLAAGYQLRIAKPIEPAQLTRVVAKLAERSRRVDSSSR